MNPRLLCLLLLLAGLTASAQPLPFPISIFSRQAVTNTDAAGWRTWLGAAGSGSSLTNTSLVGGTVTGQTNTDLTASRVMVSSPAKVPASSSVTTTELGYVSGVTSALQTQLNQKASTNIQVIAGSNVTIVTNSVNSWTIAASGGGGGIATDGGSGTNTTIHGLTINTGSTNNSLTASRAMVTDANKGVVSSATTATELGYVSGVTSALQTQLNAKAPLASPTFTGTATSPALILSSETASTIASFDGSKNLKSLATATYPSLTELTYVKGVTSALQTQLDAKGSAANLVTVSNAQVTTAANLLTLSNAVGGGRILRLVAATTDDTQTELLTSTGARAALPDGSAWTFTGRLVGRSPNTIGATWTARDSSRGWYDVASSSDGTKLVAGVNGGQIYTSTDSGATWTARDSSRAWFGIASSSDGVSLVAVVAGGQIYTSTDSGATWTARDSSRGWYDVASSADGTKLVAVVNGGQIYTSTDSGVTWTARDSSRDWVAVASSSDGTKLFASSVSSPQDIYRSTDSGATWAAISGSPSPNAIAASSDGTKLVCGVSGGQLYTSTDSGSTWTARDSSRGWSGVASSSDGTKLVAVAQSGQIYTSSGSASEIQSIHFAGQANRDSGASTITVSAGSELQLNPIGTFTWGFALDGDTVNGSVRARVTGEVDKAISWALTLDLTEVTN